MTRVKTLPPRSRVKLEDTWDLSSLFASDDQWERAFTAWEKRIGSYARFQGQLAKSPAMLASALKFDAGFERAAERLGTYAFLKTTEDQSNSDYQRMQGRYQNAASRAGQAASFMRPEILAIPTAKWRTFLASKPLKPFRVLLERMRRFKPHTLSKREENLLAMQSEMAAATNKVFTQLNNADLKFGLVKNEKGEQIELGHATFATLLHSPKRSVRKAAFHQYYTQFAAHENTLTASSSSSVKSGPK